MATKTMAANAILTRIDDAMEYAAEQAGIKLEYVGGLPVWEAMPVYRHQRKVVAICASVRAGRDDGEGCACLAVPDLSILFSDGSQKRPDISIFCREPDEQDTACTLVPEAVIEIISRGYEKKDTEVSLPFYLAQDIADIVIFNPDTNQVSHYHDGQTDEHDSPVELSFACGCRVSV